MSLNLPQILRIARKFAYARFNANHATNARRQRYWKRVAASWKEKL